MTEKRGRTKVRRMMIETPPVTARIVGYIIAETT